MDLDDHTPSLTHLREFTRARSANRTTHVDLDRLQVAAPADSRIFAFAYERFLTAVINFVCDGNRGDALKRAVAESTDRMRHSYEDCAKSMATLLTSLNPTSVRRRQRNIVVLDEDGPELVSLRVHLVFELQATPVAAFMHFPEQRLTEAEFALMETAIALAVRQAEPDAVPAIILVRTGELRPIDLGTALTPRRITFLRSESSAYRAAWSAAA